MLSQYDSLQYNLPQSRARWTLGCGCYPAGGSVAVDYGDDDDGGENVAEALPESPQVAGDQEEEEAADEKDEEEDEETMDDTVDEALEEEEEVEEEEVEEEEEEEEEDAEEEEEQQEHVSAQASRPGEDVTDSSIGSVPYQQVLPSPAQINQTKDAESEEEEEEEEEENGSVSSEPYSSSNPSADSSMTESETGTASQTADHPLRWWNTTFPTCPYYGCVCVCVLDSTNRMCLCVCVCVKEKNIRSPFCNGRAAYSLQNTLLALEGVCLTSGLCCFFYASARSV